MINPKHRKISIRRQCDLLSLSRSSLYYRARKTQMKEKNKTVQMNTPVLETPKNLKVMKRIDELYIEHPFYGSRKMRTVLNREGYGVNRKRIQRLMHLMGIQAIYPKPRLSFPGKGHKIYPYLLKNLPINRPNQVWCTDITYIRLTHGFVYLSVIMDWYSRFVLSWRLSNTLIPSSALMRSERLWQSQNRRYSILTRGFSLSVKVIPVFSKNPASRSVWMAVAASLIIFSSNDYGAAWSMRIFISRTINPLWNWRQVCKIISIFIIGKGLISRWKTKLRSCSIMGLNIEKQRRMSTSLRTNLFT